MIILRVLFYFIFNVSFYFTVSVVTLEDFRLFICLVCCLFWVGKWGQQKIDIKKFLLIQLSANSLLLMQMITSTHNSLKFLQHENKSLEFSVVVQILCWMQDICCRRKNTNQSLFSFVIWLTIIVNEASVMCLEEIHSVFWSGLRIHSFVQSMIREKKVKIRKLELTNCLQ